MLINRTERLREHELADEINRIPVVHAAVSNYYGVIVYPDYESFRDDERECLWFAAVSAKDTSISDVLCGDYDAELAEKVPEDIARLVWDKIVEFIYGGKDYATKQPVTA